MLPRPARLRRSADFSKVYRDGRFFHASLLTLHVFRRDDGEATRVGFVAGKKVGGIAKRNLYKRRTRSAVEREYKGIEGGLDLIFVLRPAILGADYPTIERFVGEALAKAGVAVE